MKYAHPHGNAEADDPYWADLADILAAIEKGNVAFELWWYSPYLNQDKMQVNRQHCFILFLFLCSAFTSVNLAAQDCSSWTFVANERENFALSGTQMVRYGANGKYVYKTLSGTQACSNTNFGSDPIEGVVKKCHVCERQAPESGSYTFSRGKVEEEMESSGKESTRDGDYICTSEKIDAVKSFNTNFVLESSGLEGIIYPGALVYGEDILNGSYQTINVPRRPLNISTSASFVNGAPAISLSNPNQLSSVRTDINELMVRQQRGQVQAETSYEMTEVYNEKQLEMAFSGRFSRNGLSIYGAFNMAQNSNKKVIVAKFLQKYYTIDADAPNQPSDFFQRTRDYQQVTNNAKTPLYVSQVVYGRAAYFYLETEENSMEAEAELKAAYKGVMEAEVNASTKVRELLSKSTIKVLVIGGNGTASSKIINSYQGFEQAVLEGSVFEPSALARPIAYTLKFLTNETANMNATTSYTKRECVKNTNTFRVTIDRIVLTRMSPDEPGKYNEVGGNVKIKAMADGATSTFEEPGIISPEGAFVPTFRDVWGTRMIVYPQPGTAHYNSAKYFAGVSQYSILSSSGGNVLLQENADGNLAGDYINVKYSKVFKIVEDQYSNVRFQIKVRIREDDARDTILEEDVWVNLADTNKKDQYIELRDKDIYRVYYSIDSISE